MLFVDLIKAAIFLICLRRSKKFLMECLLQPGREIIGDKLVIASVTRKGEAASYGNKNEVRSRWSYFYLLVT